MYNKKLSGIINSVTEQNFKVLQKYLSQEQYDFLHNNPVMNLGFLKNNSPLVLDVQAEYGLFPSHETHPEKTTYTMINPASIAGIFRSVYAKPEFIYVPLGAVMLNPNIQTLEYTINGFSNKFNTKKQYDPNDQSSEDKDQLNRVVLKRPHYLIMAYIVPITSSEQYSTQEKHTQIFYRNWLGKKFFKTPCMGYTEFPISDLNPATDTLDRVNHSEKYSMLLDWDYVPVENGKVMPKRKDYRTPVFYKCDIKNGAYVIGDDLMAYVDMIQKEMIHHKMYGKNKGE